MKRAGGRVTVIAMSTAPRNPLPDEARNVRRAGDCLIGSSPGTASLLTRGWSLRSWHGPQAVAAAMVEAGADAVGANCGVGVELSAPICKRLHGACALPIWIKPNAGLPKIEGAVIRYETSAEYFASYFAALADAGASFVGACCGSTPEFIRALVAARAAKS